MAKQVPPCPRAGANRSGYQCFETLPGAKSWTAETEPATAFKVEVGNPYAE